MDYTHPFEDGNGRTARLLSGYILDLNGYGFNGFVVPIMVNQRIRSYELSDFTKEHEKEIVKVIK